MIDVLIVDDQPVVRAGLAVVLGAEPDLRVVGQAGTGEEAILLAERLRPDVVCMDVRMPGAGGIAATREIAERLGGAVRTLILTTFDVDEDVFAALEAGASGFLLKGADEEVIAGAIRSVATGGGTLDARVTRRVVAEFARRGAGSAAPARADDASLTPRERDVLHLLAAGRSNPEIAAALYVGVTTVKFHVQSVLAKTQSRDRLQAAIWGVRRGFGDEG